MMPGTFMSELQYGIRVAIPGDGPVVSPLATELGYPDNRAETADRLGRVLATPGNRVLVAETEEREVIGWIHVFGTVRVESEGFAELGGLVVAESWRGRGVGAQLVAAAERWAMDNGYLKLRIRSREERTEAHRFFERLGFVAHKTQHVFERPLVGDQ
jgi:GNAT superfamily N-acetyltransferase